MTQRQQKEAFRLWKAYKTQTAAYQALAAELRLSVGELNAKMRRLAESLRKAKG